ncbi:MAG: hypothetical protein HEP71_05125 [Roseivirga sp.]|nr:hypothetical protein [Roseivirga sp.]
MELFLNISLSLLGLFLIVYIFWHIKEILRSLLKGTIRAIKDSIPVIIVRGIIAGITYTKEKQAPSKTTLNDKPDDLPKTIPIQDSAADKFIIINSVLIKSEIENKIDEACSHFQELSKVSFKTKTKEDLTIIELNGIESMLFFVYLIQYFVTDYGIDNTYGYLDSERLSFFFYQDPGDNIQVIGKTDNGVTFAYSTESFDVSDNLLKLGPYPVKRKLSTGFFKQLIQKT